VFVPSPEIMGLKPLLLVGVGVLGVGVLLQIVAMATPNWAVSKLQEIGPWRSCLGTVCGENTGNTSGRTDAVRAMSVLGVLLGIASAGAAMLTLVIGILGKDEIKLLPMVAGAAGLGAAGFTFLGLVIWAADLGGFDLGYSWGLSFVAMVCFAAGGVLTFIGGR